MPWKKRDDGKGQSRCGQGQTQTGHKWDDANNSDDRHQPQMADDDDPDSRALAKGDITRYRALVARISYLSQYRSDLKFALMQVCCAMAKPTMRDMERVKRIGRYLVGKRRARCWMLQRRCAWSTAEVWAKRSTSTCRICGYRRLPNLAGSPRGKSART